MIIDYFGNCPAVPAAAKRAMFKIRPGHKRVSVPMYQEFFKSFQEPSLTSVQIFGIISYLNIKQLTSTKKNTDKGLSGAIPIKSRHTLFLLIKNSDWGQTVIPYLPASSR